VAAAVSIIGLVVFFASGGSNSPSSSSADDVGTPSVKTSGPTPENHSAKSTTSQPVETPTEVVKNQPSAIKESNKPIPSPSKTVAATSGRVKEIFRAHCLECHGGSKTNGGVKILDRELLVKKEKVVPGQPDESVLFLHITAEDETAMPPAGQPRLSSGDIELIRAWIAEGASPFPADLPAPAETNKDVALQGVVGVDYVLKAILQDVQTLKPEDRRSARYFSLNHLLTGGATDEELHLHRDALAKTINHLTWEPNLVHPRPIEASKTIFRIDLRTLGWDRHPFKIVRDEEPAEASPVNLFDLVLLEYPYATIYQSSATFNQLVSEFLSPASQVRPIPYVRADWFVSVATQPPLYEDLLGLPFTPHELRALASVIC
jgi:serine/threonine-protein kinase